MGKDCPSWHQSVCSNSGSVVRQLGRGLRRPGDEAGLAQEQHGDTGPAMLQTADFSGDFSVVLLWDPWTQLVLRIWLSSRWRWAGQTS